MELYGNLLVPQRFTVPLKPTARADGGLIGGVSSAPVTTQGVSVTGQPPYGPTVDGSASSSSSQATGDAVTAEAGAEAVDGQDWPEGTGGMKLGSMCNRIRCGAFKTRREEFIALGFEFESQAKNKGNSCLQSFKRMVCIYIHIYACIYIHANLHTYIYTCIHICT